MGMSIDEALETIKGERWISCQEKYVEAMNLITDTMRKYQMMQADYENRLKADLEAILVELQLEIEELRLDRPLMSRGYECYGHKDKTPTEIRQECADIIQQKIDALKAESEDKDENKFKIKL